MIQTRWEKDYSNSYKSFIRGIWNDQPDFIVPVGRKSAKLFNALDDILDEIKYHVFYRDFFEMFPQDLHHSLVSIVDDAVQTTSTLLEYRNFFISKGVKDENVRTHAFIGHHDLLFSSKEKKYDQRAEIAHFLPESNYRQYLLCQSDHLIAKGIQVDIDHLVLEMVVPTVESEMIQQIWECLKKWGYLYRLDPIGNNEIYRLGFCSKFFDALIPTHIFPNVVLSGDFVNKLRFIYMSGESRLVIIPMVFPQMKLNEKTICKLKDHLPFVVACKQRKEHQVDKYCYLSICFWLSTLLAQQFLRLIEKEVPDLRKCFKNIRVRSSNLARYLGSDLGAEVASHIQHFVKEDISSQAEVRFTPELTSGTWLKSSLPFSEESIPEVIAYLRQGYEDAVHRNGGNRVGVTYTQSVAELLKINRGTHPLIFTEVLDELCDFGVIVPETRFNTDVGAWQRVYRTGEGEHSELGWERSKRLLGLATKALGGRQIGRMYFQKALANFVCDFPASVDKKVIKYPENHSFASNPSLLGAEVFAAHPTGRMEVSLIPLNLTNENRKKWEDLARFITFDKKSKTFSCKGGLHDVKRYLESPRDFLAYFQFLKTLKETMGSVDALNALALCRETGWFYQHLMFNVYRWTDHGSLGTFLEGLRSGKNYSERWLDFAGNMAASAEGKLNYLKNFPTILQTCEEIADQEPVLFGDVWHELIKANIDVDKIKAATLRDTRIKKASIIVMALRVLDALIRIKIKPDSHRTGERTKRALELGPQMFEKIGIKDFDIERFVNEQCTRSEIYDKIYPVYRRIVSRIGHLPNPDENVDFVDQWRDRARLRSESFLRMLISADTDKEKKLQTLKNRAIEILIKASGFIDPVVILQEPIDEHKISLQIKDKLGKCAYCVLDLKKDDISYRVEE